MKIKKFNENSDYEISISRYEAPITNAEKIRIFIRNFTGDAGDIPDWLNTVAPTTKIPEYQNAISYNKMLRNKALKFSDDKNLPKYKEYILIDEKILNLEEEINKLNEYKENVSYVKGTSELMYSFQKELLDKDVEKFYDFFLDEQIKENYDNIYDEVHPNLLRNKKYKKLIDTLISARKFNL